MDYQWISSLLTSYEYNRDYDEVVQIIDRTIKRFKHIRVPHEYIDDDVDIFIGAIICRYGDYGTSPRFGWLEKPHENIVMALLELELKEYKELAGRSTDEED